MYIRSTSYLIHKESHFYAQNVSPLPVYNKIFVDGEVKYIPDGFSGDTCIIDPDLPIYRRQWIEHNAKSFKEAFDLSNWVRMNGGNINVSLESWMSLDFFMREAIKMASNEVTKEINDEHKKAQESLERRLEDAKEYKSPFEGAPKPSFIP